MAFLENGFKVVVLLCLAPVAKFMLHGSDETDD
jgi:hypothetical protein